MRAFPKPTRVIAGALLLLYASPGLCCQTSEATEKTGPGQMVRIAFLGYGGKLEVDLRKHTFTAFRESFADGDWGLGQCSITQGQADALRLPLARAYLWEFDPTGAKFKPARRWIGKQAAACW